MPPPKKRGLAGAVTSLDAYPHKKEMAFKSQHPFSAIVTLITFAFIFYQFMKGVVVKLTDPFSWTINEVSNQVDSGTLLFPFPNFEKSIKFSE